MSGLIREALRMRPDRLVVGECRGAEVRDLLMALNTGHGGCATTVHANAVADVAPRLAGLGLLAGLAPDVLAALAVAAIDLVVHVRVVPGRGREVVEGGVLVRDERGGLRSVPLSPPAAAGQPR